MHFNLPVQTDCVLPEPKQYSAVEFVGIICTQLSLQLYFDVSFISFHFHVSILDSESIRSSPWFWLTRVRSVVVGLFNHVLVTTLWHQWCFHGGIEYPISFLSCLLSRVFFSHWMVREVIQKNCQNVFQAFQSYLTHLFLSEKRGEPLFFIFLGPNFSTYFAILGGRRIKIVFARSA